MNSNTWEVSCKSNKNIKLSVSIGHFATSHSHIDHYMGFTDMRTNCHMAKLCARELAKFYSHSKPVDTIICLEYTQVIGSYVADILTEPGSRGVNERHRIYVITPESNSSGQLVFSGDVQNLVANKSVLVLISTVSTGRSLERALECIAYYGGHLVGVAALFSAVDDMAGVPIHKLFSPDDVPDYHSYQSSECPYCKRGRKLDGLVNAAGYTKI
ncbi:MAG: orotate phosphoribosyltransferase [Clostridia bacterium]|nr:orotate phosphoribosyltransferase [Clostridia bacterium]MBQ2518130.1 orotate phosphoribosyltransferase [Clostridia bacterium]MBR6428539.1 orotate phosphoribosyltransferase [Clostridia bacterium]